MTRSEQNATHLVRLHPPFAALVARWLAGQDAIPGRAVTLVQGRRTFAEQAALWQQGRTTDGARVTNAHAGQSYHNYGLAVDFLDAGLDGIVQQSDWEATDYAEIVRPAVALGMVWGGAWRRVSDRPHLEWHPWLSASDAERLAARADANGYLPPEMWAEIAPPAEAAIRPT